MIGLGFKGPVERIFDSLYVCYSMLYRAIESRETFSLVGSNVYSPLKVVTKVYSISLELRLKILLPLHYL